MKLKEWARKQGICYQTAWRWFKAGSLPVPFYQAQSGTIIILEKDEKINLKNTVIYARVSSYEKKDDLLRQVERCSGFAAANGIRVEKVIKEIASGMNDHRPKLTELLKSKPESIIVEHKDRLTRFGFNYIEVLLEIIGCKLIVINRDTEEKDDLMKDLISIMTSFCCRLYGLRRGRTKIKEIKKCAGLVPLP
jgi:predicted site-specific integrase-resolvase